MEFLGNNLNFVFEKFALPTMAVENIHLPLGISFFIFHSISYVVDIYRKRVCAQRNIFNMALYISLFPQLIAGPIVRYHYIADQINNRSHSLTKFAEGVRRFVIGLGKKVLLANQLALPCDRIFALPVDQLTTWSCWLGIISYTLQIYFDFSGYTDMAIGLGLMFGFQFPENFNYPYAAKTMREFWQRWHISLSTWFRDYVYIPLGGNRVGGIHQYFNLFIVFFLCGLWHGASWQFIAWGLYHGFFLCLEKFLRMHQNILAISKIPMFFRNVLGHIYTLLVVMLGWVLFRAENFAQAFAFYKALFDQRSLNLLADYTSLALINNHMIISCLIVASLGAFPWKYLVRKFINMDSVFYRKSILCAVSDAWYMGVFIFAGMEIVSGAYNPFIYFRF
jgi:alginate O-acetyltransferase complex protein AlgI